MDALVRENSKVAEQMPHSKHQVFGSAANTPPRLQIPGLRINKAK